MDLREWRVEGAVLLGRYGYTTPHAPLEAHHHGDLIEVCYLDRGHQSYEMDGRRYELKGGDVLVVPPGTEHGTGGEPEDRGVLYWLILRPPAGRGRFLGLPAEDARKLLRCLSELPWPHFRGRVSLRESLEAVFKAAASEPAALSRTEIRNRLVRFLLDLVDCAAQAPSVGPSPPIQAVLDAMDRTLDRNLPLVDYAHLAGLSLSRFKVRFKQEVGTSPRDHLLQRRIEKARQRLADPGAKVTAVAMQLGFSSSQYFATVFKRYTGRCPSSVRRGADASG